MSMSWERRRVLQVAAALALFPLMPKWSRAYIPSLSGSTMGTRYCVRIHQAPDGLYLPKLKRHIERVFATTESLMSTYRSNSELSRFNTSSSTDWQPLSSSTARVVETALRIQEQSGGAFNPAAGMLIDYWGFGAKPKLIPDVSASPPVEILESVKNANTALNSSHLRKSHPQTALDLNAIAKGDAIDGVAVVLEQFGIDDYLIEIGGEIRARGRGPDDAGWRVGLEDPETNIFITIRLDGKSVATSGDYVSYFMQNDKRYSHVIDPRSGRPIDHNLAVVSVVADSAMEADAWATALLVMGLEQGHHYAQRNSMAALFLQREGEAYRQFMTPEFELLTLYNAEFSL